jgi:teichuronic acid biosynthesis glycosyltransferase TuaG
MALVSVILPSFRMGKFVSQALASVGSQTYGEWEVILVDDCGPEDGTREAVAEFANRHPSRRVKYIRNAENVGCGHSRNIAIAEASGDILACLDPDDYWGHLHLERAVSALAHADLCFCRCRSIDTHGNDMGPHLGDRIDGLIASFPSSLFRENFLLPSATVIRRRTFDEVGPFISREVASNAADWDFYLRCIARDVRITFLADESCYYRSHEGSATANYLKMTRACVCVLRKNRRAASGRMRRELSDSLHEQLCKLVYLEVSFREREGLKHAGEALRLKPTNAAPFIQVAKGLRNNWKNLR